MEQHKQKRPFGISILSWFHIIGGVLGEIVVAFVLARYGVASEIWQMLAVIGLPGPLMIPATVFLFGLAIISGVGMWRGKRWGWYLASLYYAYSLVRNLNTLMMIRFILSNIPAEETVTIPHGQGFYFLRYGGRIMAFFLLYLYFFKGTVRAFFGLSEQEKWKPIIGQAGICAAILVLLSVLSGLMN